MIARLDSPRSRTILLLVGLTALAVGLDLWQRLAQRAGGTSWLDESVCAVSRPLQTVLLSSSGFLEKEWKATVHARELVDENEQLLEEIAALEVRLAEIEEKRSEMARADALRSVQRIQARGQLATVIGVGESAWSNYLTIDRGSKDGVQARDVAVAADGIVGQVYAVAAHSSRVMPLTEPESAVAVRIQRSRETGILKGLRRWRCQILYLHPEADVRPGDLVITSGLGGVFPKGLRVGKVSSVSSDTLMPGKVAEVDPAVKLRKVESIVLLRADKLIAGITNR